MIPSTSDVCDVCSPHIGRLEQRGWPRNKLLSLICLLSRNSQVFVSSIFPLFFFFLSLSFLISFSSVLLCFSYHPLVGMDILCSDKTGTLTLNKLTVGEPVIIDHSNAALTPEVSL